MAEQGQIEGKEGHVQAMEAGMGGLGRIQGCSLDIQRQDQENQATDKTELCEKCEK